MKNYTAVGICALFAFASLSHAQENHPTKSDQPVAAAAGTVADFYPFESCPITGKKLGGMGDPVVKKYDGREVRFCCPACPPKFEKDLPDSFAKLNEKVVKDQRPLYPLKTSVVTGKDLPATPYELVYRNRLVLLGAESEKAEFLKDAPKYLGTLNAAVIAQQGKDYVLKSCPVSNEAFGGDMGESVDMVVAGRLIRLCCKGCTEDVEKNPAKFVAMVDAARKGETPKPADDHKHDHKDHDDHHSGK